MMEFSFWPYTVNMYILCNVLAQHVYGFSENPDLRQLLQNYQENQELVANLGTIYEIVYPTQVRRDWVSGLSTRITSNDNTITHLRSTSVVIKTVRFTFHLDLELNINLLPPTLVQNLFRAKKPIIIDKDIENCYYQATIRNYTNAAAAFHTCNGIKGVIYFGKDIYLIHPLYGDYSARHPHLLYHYYDGNNRAGFCGNNDGDETLHCLQEQLQLFNDMDNPVRNKYLELALILDKSFFEKYNSEPKNIIAEAIQIINCADLHFRFLNTSLSLIYLELWVEDQISIESNITDTLENFKEYIMHKFSRISIDAAHLLTGSSFNNNKYGLSTTNSVCTMTAAGISVVESIYKTHFSSLLVAHMLGHNLGMYHDHKCCRCASSECIMSNNIQPEHPFFFSSCSVDDYFRTLQKGYGHCLFNMPNMRKSICGNGILEKDEECDCGTSEECLRKDSCCDPITCKFIKHAQCSSGPCCKKCKLLSPDHMCHPSQGECDIPEFCDGENEQCPEDLYKKNGVVCNDGLSYCYYGQCPSLRQQCEHFWGYGADTANAVCYERLNIQGTPNGNCGPDGKGGFVKCAEQNTHCGSLQCHQGQKEPVLEHKPIHFVVNRINIDGMAYECKTIPSESPLVSHNHAVVKDGSKCGYQKLCINQSCISISSISNGSCPVNNVTFLVCSDHGTCTNTNTCICDEGWSGFDCSTVIELPTIHEELGIKTDDQNEVSNYISEESANAEQNVKDSLIITIIIASILIGLALLTSAVLIFMYSRNLLCKHSNSYRSYK